GGPAALVDRPDDQALPAPHVPSREHSLDARAELAILRLRVGPGILLHPKLIEELILRPAEAHRQEDELGRKDLLRAGDIACRRDVPTQSVPVSPPPMTMTSLSLAEM